MKTRRRQGLCLLVGMSMVISAAFEELQALHGQDLSLVPSPLRAERGTGYFQITQATRIRADAASLPAAELLAERLRAATGYAIRIEETASICDGDIRLTTQGPPETLNPEGYDLEVTPQRVIIKGADAAGVFYGTQTLLEMLPPAVFAESIQTAAWRIPAARIYDQPRFPWRGFLLDVARHFFTKEEIKKVIAVLALHKVNRLQLHLTDDQGWRLEIRGYPRLTEIGAWRNSIGFELDPRASKTYGPDGRYGGFYTQAEMREIVAYAAARHIEVVPEIEMPGHASAALAAYPELSCSGGPYTTEATGGIFAGVYCAGQEKTFDFVANVLREVAEVFPGRYIHIGGDEVDKGNWQKCARCQARLRSDGLKNEHELQSYFIRRVQKIVQERGRTLVGWSEIREGGLAENVTLMDWIGGGLEAATSGHDVIMSPTTHCYLDYYQSTNHATEPRAIGGYVPLGKTYEFEPVPAGLPRALEHRILGAQGNLWTEFIASLKHVEYMAYPRLCALAEVNWSPREARDFGAFAQRLEQHLKRLEVLGVNYRRPLPGVDVPVSR